jgi:hypothetical protein
MADKEKSSKGIFSIFKKDKSSAAVTEEPAQPIDERRRLVSSLSASEKAKRRSTIGPSSNIGAGFATLTTASPGVSPAPSPHPATVTSGKTDLVDTQFSKMVRRPSSTSVSRDIISTNSVAKQNSTENLHGTLGRMSSKKELSKDEKKQRRKSLLGAIAPVSSAPSLTSEGRSSVSANSSAPSLNLAMGSGTGVDTLDTVLEGPPSPSKLSKDALKARRSTNIGTIFKKDNSLEELSFSKLGVQSSTSSVEKQMQKQKQKQLQKQMERDAKKQEKQEKVQQERAHEILQAQLELGRERATMPEPQPRYVSMAPSRPARLATTL